LVGEESTTQTLAPGATVQALADRLYNAYPGLADMRLKFAVNARYASMGTALQDGDQVACIPPVGGG
jgi:molybdopterin converting factor small subunit